MVQTWTQTNRQDRLQYTAPQLARSVKILQLLRQDQQRQGLFCHWQRKPSVQLILSVSLVAAPFIMPRSRSAPGTFCAKRQGFGTCRVATRQPTAHYHRSQQQEPAPALVLVGGDGQDARATHGSGRSATVHPSAFVPNGPRLVVVATLG